MSAKKILHMHFGKEGGAERFFVNLVTAFAERSLEQRFVIRPGRLWREEVARLGPVIENNYRRVSLSSLWLTWRVHAMIRQWQPDVIMSWMSRSSRLMPRNANAVKVTRLGDYPRHLKHMRNTDCIVSNAPGIAEHCRTQGWTRPIRIISNFPRAVTPVAIDRATLKTPRDAFVIASSGRFIRRKGFDTLVRAAAKVPGAWLWLIGEGDKRQELEALAVEVGLGDRIRFTGWVDEPMHSVAASDVFVIPSRHEPLGNVILESWHAGVPTVSTRSEGPTWFVADGVDALMCDIDDVDGMAAAIQRIRDDPLLARRLIDNGRAKLAAQFTEEKVIGQYLDLFAGHFGP